MHCHTLYAISRAWLWLTVIFYTLKSAIVFMKSSGCVQLILGNIEQSVCCDQLPWHPCSTCSDQLPWHPCSTCSDQLLWQPCSTCCDQLPWHPCSTCCDQLPWHPCSTCKYSDWNQFFAQCHKIAIRPHQVSLNIVMDSLSFILDIWAIVAVSLYMEPFFFSSPCHNRRPMLSIVYNIYILSDLHISFTLLH